MSKFIRWSGIAHTILAAFHPKLKLGQAREIFAAALGHKSYASAIKNDIQALESTAKYVVLDQQLVLQRAIALGIPLTADQWWSVQHSISPGRVCGGCWIGSEWLMQSAAKSIFESSSLPLFDQIAAEIGFCDGHWARTAEALPGHSDADEIALLVHGEVQAFHDDVALATPVIAEVRFRKVGRQLFSEGRLVDAIRHGVPRSYEPIFEGEIYGP